METSSRTGFEIASATLAGAAAAALAALVLSVSAAESTLADAAKQKRSAAAVREFKRANPCPANGRSAGSCPGWIVDHIVPLCAGGADAAANMQWQTVAQAKEKDKGEWKQCRAMKKGTRT